MKPLRGSKIFLFKSAITLKSYCVTVKSRKFSLAELTWEAFRSLIVTYSNSAEELSSPLILSNVNETTKDKLAILTRTE